MKSRNLGDGRTVSVRDNGGLKKRCGCPRRQWSKCVHPWHFGFAYDGKEYRWSLHKVAERPPGYRMSKTEAQAIADRLRSDIRIGRSTGTASPDTRLTFGDVVERYLERHVRVPTRRPAAQQVMEWHLGVLRRAEVPATGGATIRLEHKPLTAISKADVETVRDGRRAAAKASGPTERVRPGCKDGEVGINRLLARLRHVFSFAVAEGYVSENPFKRHGVTVVKLDSRAEAPRHRRLDPGEEARLLQHAGDHLRALIVALLFTGCRVGELLNLTWNQIRRGEDGKPRWLMLPATNTKTYRLRPIPIGTRLSAELEMRQHGPDGTAFGLEAFVFGNRVGEKVNSVKTAWAATCRRAGISGLQVRDLRREFASRLRESGASDHDVRDFLGHANITTTSRYLASTPLRLEQALANLEARNRRTSVAQTADRQEQGERPQTVEVTVNKEEEMVPRGRIELPTP
jgi:integrase